MGISETEDDYFLVVEFVRGGSLCKILMDPNIELSWGSRIRMAVDIAVALLYLHNKNCIHRDLKSENILVRQQCNQCSRTHAWLGGAERVNRRRIRPMQSERLWLVEIVHQGRQTHVGSRHALVESP